MHKQQITRILDCFIEQYYLNNSALSTHFAAVATSKYIRVSDADIENFAKKLKIRTTQFIDGWTNIIFLQSIPLYRLKYYRKLLNKK